MLPRLSRPAGLALALAATGCGFHTSGVHTDGSGGSGGGSGVEDCFNDQDDDGDGRIDCADKSCAPVAVCDAVPDGWTVIRAGQSADPSAPPGTCADGATARRIYFTQPMGAPSCSPCDCAFDAAAAQCSAPLLQCFYSNTSCAGAADLAMQPSAGGCTDLGGVPGGLTNLSSCLVGAPGNLSSAGCTASGGVAESAPLWGGAVLVCESASSTGGCATGKRCVHADGSADGPVCITKDGSDPCPTGWPTSIDAFTGGDDHRTCSACSCDVGCAGGGFVVHDHNGCTEYSPPVAVSGGCVVVQDLFDGYEASVGATAAQAMYNGCPGGVGQGQVDPTGPVRICCK